MDLYISPLSGSLSVHIACLEAGLAPRICRVDRKTKTLDGGRDYRTISPLGIVPAISLPDGGVLTESVAILQYIADQVPEKRLAPPAGTLERYRLQEWLNFTTSELHKRHIWPVFSSSVTPEMKLWSRANVGPRLEHVARHLESRDYLLDRFSVADCYMFWALFVAPHGGISLDAYQSLRTYVDRIKNRPSVTAALAVEGPLYAREAAQGNAPVSVQPNPTASLA